MLKLTTLDEDTQALAERLAQVHEQVNHHRAAFRSAWDERAEVARELHRVRAYPCSRIARELGVVERTVWSWLTKVEKE
ncbi:helix-turn-helix domain-containing protein [Mycobacterium sp. Lab-001]|uniref:helix-turn-helix domain-containing protein n=1 Tax=Mycobacterium sp. Lab-001 TaxID=3410136 RepID=UPI003D18510C